MLTRADIDGKTRQLFNGYIIEANRFAGNVGFTKPKLIWDEAVNDWTFDISDCWWQRAKDFREAEIMIMEDCGIRRTDHKIR